jgi:hypothetical protein
MKAWLETQLTHIPPRSGLADAIRYSLTRWSSLCCFLDDGRIELDTNTVERAIRPITLGRKNHLFAGSDGGAARWATVCSLISTAKLNDVEPFAYLKDVLERMSNGHPIEPPRRPPAVELEPVKHPDLTYVSGMDAYLYGSHFSHNVCFKNLVQVRVVKQHPNGSKRQILSTRSAA